jgi:hypothetical protein
MKYAYYDLYPLQFEKLVVSICHFILGPGVQEFADGKDAGRDARFNGTATCFPSETAPISGKVVVQAKHTIGIADHFSDPSFSGDGVNSVLSIEIPKIKNLKDAKELDHYILFSNRKLSAQAEQRIRQRLLDQADVTSSHLVGVEGMERQLKAYPRAAEMADVDPIDSPLRVSPDRIAQVIRAIGKDLPVIKVPPVDEITRTALLQKNTINGLSPEYAKAISKFLKYSDQFKEFLAHPENTEILSAYEDAADEFRTRIISTRKDHVSFDKVLDYLLQQLFDRDPDLSANRKMTRALVYYMYWNCDIGLDHACCSRVNTTSRIRRSLRWQRRRSSICADGV